MKSALAFFRLAGLVVGTLLVLGFCPVPFVVGAAAQALFPRRLSWSAVGLLGTAAFLVAWLALDHVPLAFLRREGAPLLPWLVAGWLLSMAGSWYAASLVRALRPRRFAERPLPDASASPLGAEDFRVTVSALRFWVRAIRGSVLAFAFVLVAGLVSMGLLGLGLYYPVAPVLRWGFPPVDGWHGDWVWPATIGVGMAWSAGFLLAGVADHRLARRGQRAAWRVLAYLGTLWVWDLVLWTLTLAFAPGREG